MVLTTGVAVVTLPEVVTTMAGLVVVVVVVTVLAGAAGGGAETTWEVGSEEQPAVRARVPSQVRERSAVPVRVREPDGG